MTAPRCAVIRDVAGWTCPECHRQFGRRNQSHECATAMSLDDYFGGRPSLERAIFEAVSSHLDEIGDIVVEAVGVGIFFKRVRTFAELRPMRNRVRLWVLLSRRLDGHPRIGRTYHGTGVRSAYSIDLHDPSEVDRPLVLSLCRIRTPVGCKRTVPEPRTCRGAACTRWF